MTELRALRESTRQSQQEFARLLDVPVNSLRMWDSGMRPTPSPVIQQARAAVANHRFEHEPLTLPALALELHVHVRTLQAAARTGRLEVQLAVRSVFGRPLRLATRAAGRAFLRRYYKRYAGREPGTFAVAKAVPADYDEQLKQLRHARRWTLAEMAQRLGAANKAVVYQWESRRRVPSPVFWQRVEQLQIAHKQWALRTGALSTTIASPRAT